MAMLKAIGKYIDTLPLARLISREENGADSVIIEVDRYYGVHDLSEFTFVMRGVTESGAETQTELVSNLTKDEENLHLVWKIGSLFTAEAGTLFLDLVAYHHEPEVILRYQLPSVEIRDIPEGKSEATDQESYTAFWTEIREKINSLDTSVNVQGTIMRDLATTVGSHITQIDELEHRIQILVMTQAEYEALETPDERTLYVLKN